MRTQILKCCYALGFGVAMLLNVPSQAQNVKTATNGISVVMTPGIGYNISPFIAPTTATGTSTCTSINADMIEVDNSSAQPKCVFGANTGEMIAVAGFTGLTNSAFNPATNYSGINVVVQNLGTTTNEYQLPIPYWNSSNAGSPVGYIDVAVGILQDQYYSTGNIEYFALVAYECMGEIWLEMYYIRPTAGAMLRTFPPQPIMLTPATSNPVVVSASGGTAKRPHIELFHNKMVPANGKNYIVESYAIVWEQETTPGSPEVWGGEGPIASVGSIPTAPSTTFYIANGKEPDVVAVTASLATSTFDNSRAYVTYTTPNHDEVHLSMWESGVYVPTFVTQFGLTAAPPDEYLFPRISGPMYYDFSDPGVADDPVAVVAVTENIGGLNYGVTTFWHHDVAGSLNDVVLNDASNYMNMGFDRSVNNSIMPSITGAGRTANSFSASPYFEYPTAFYTDYTHNGTSFPNSGDFIAFGIDLINVPNPVPLLDGGTDYWEMEWQQIPRTSPFSLSGDVPCVAVATANNSGVDLFSIYFDGADIIYSFTGSSYYGFKPTSVAGTTKDGYKVYPNPVTTALNITNADGVSYTITDVSGRVVSTGKFTTAKATVNTARLVPGNYIIQLSKGDDKESVKFTKQ